MANHPSDDEAPTVNRRAFLGKSAVAAVAAVGVPSLLGACDSGSGTDARPDDASAAASAPSSGARNYTIGADPWTVVHEKLAHTVGVATNVSVKALERTGTNSYLQSIVTDDDRVGSGLATVLRSSYKFTDSRGVTTNLAVLLYNSGGKRHLPRTISRKDDLALAMKDAFASNGLNFGVLKESLATGKPIVAVFNSAVVQFQASASSDYYGNFLQVASRAASDIFNGSVAGYPLASTTRDLKMC